MALNRRREQAEQLAALLDGTVPADQASGDLRELATLAVSVTANVARPQLDLATRDAIRERVLAEVHADLHAARDTVHAPAPARARRRMAVTAGVASVVIGAAGVGVAAQHALPGDTLYNVKQATESARVAAAGDLTEQGRLELALAAERLEELHAAVERGGVRDDALIDTLARMDARSRDGAVTLVRVAERTGDAALLDEVVVFTQTQTAGLVEVYDRLPVTVRPYAEDSLAVLRAIRIQLLAPVLNDETFTNAAHATDLDRLLRSDPLPAEVGGRGEDTTTTTTTRTPGPSGDAGDGERVGDDGPLPSTPQLPGTGGGEGRGVVPRLPGPLDDVGRTVDETVGGVLDGADDLVGNGGRRVGDVVDDVGDTVGGVGDTVGDVVDDAGDLLDDTVGGVGGLIGGGRDRD